MTLITPVEDETALPDVIASIETTARDGNMKVAFRIDDQTYTYTFRRERDGLRLKE